MTKTKVPPKPKTPRKPKRPKYRPGRKVTFKTPFGFGMNQIQLERICKREVHAAADFHKYFGWQPVVKDAEDVIINHGRRRFVDENTARLAAELFIAYVRLPKREVVETAVQLCFVFVFPVPHPPGRIAA